jgi:peptide-methionine (S)-S-oxide reductase
MYQGMKGLGSTLTLVMGGSLLAAGILFGGQRSTAEEARMIPPPAVDASPDPAATATAVLAGGCFWGVQGVFQHVKGVANAVSGYAGGEQSTARYETVGSGSTGHAESVRITYDPRIISYGQILQIFFSVAHDPTQLNRQGPDHGTQYRSAIFPQTPEQEAIATAYIAQLNDAQVFKSAIVTKIEDDRSFYRAEAHHQDFMARNPGHPYIAINDLPKIASLKRLFSDTYRDEPALAGKTN